MKSLWDDAEAAKYTDELGQRVYTSRLLGRNKSLVLHGGGNTSVKIIEKNIFAADETLLYVKGSGWDLETIDRPGFSPVRLQHLLELAKLENLSDPDMVNELKTNMTSASAPTPSVEAILHALLPYKYVDHTHADAVVTLTNTPDGLKHIKNVYGDSVVVIPYIMPGFDLARLCAEKFFAERNDNTVGMVLMNHGIFSFGETAKESYEQMIKLVSAAEDYLKNNDAWVKEEIKTSVPTCDLREELAALRYSISQYSGFPVILRNQRDESTLSFTRHAEIEKLSQQGPATPDHVIRTKRLPMLGHDIQAYSDSYKKYFAAHSKRAKDEKTMLDTAPRVVLDKEIGLCTIGRSAKDALVVQEIYQHTIDIILRADKLDEYQALPAGDIFDVEYWDLEQAKLRSGKQPPQFTGEIALVTGAASGIGQACVDSLLARGTAVLGMDLNKRVETLYLRPDYTGIVGDVSKADDIEAALEKCAQTFGGLDILILNAGIFPSAQNIADIDMSVWQKTLDINLTANLRFMQTTYPLLKLAPKGGRIVVIGSKNVAAPGPGASAYSASKAALNQLMRIAALEWGGEGIRINTLHPDAVFDTGIWTDEVLEQRAKHYNMSVDEYKKRNLMKVEITSHDVAELAAEMCGALFAKVLAAQVPIDGGDMRIV